MGSILFFLLLCLFIFGALVLASVFVVKQQTVVLVERFGRFVRVAQPGLNFRIPFVEQLRGPASLRVLQLDVRAETKTQDNVFVHITISVQYRIIEDRVYDAYYRLADPVRQINSYVFDVIRARVPRISIDRLFEEKEEIASAIKAELNETMNNFGFEIINSLVTDIEPDQNVKDAMNQIIAAQRIKIAAHEKAEADKIMKVKAAEADAESKALQGKGIADQRRAIIDGLKDSVEHFQSSVPGSTAQDVMHLVLMTQYFDTLKEIGHNSNTILIPHSPGGMQDIEAQIRNAFIAANEVDKVSGK
jgi:regulator of protease activity HflC (stomatin/prohibitin superfamily)